MNAAENLPSQMLTKLATWLTFLMPIAMFVGSAAIDIVMSLTAVTFLADRIARRDMSWLKITWVRIALILWVYLVIRAFFALEISWALQRSLPWIRFPLFTLALTQLTLRSEKNRKILFYVSVVAVTYGVLEGLCQYFFNTELMGHPRWDVSRLTGPFTRPILGITLAWLTLPLIAHSMACMIEENTTGFRKLLLMSALLMIIAIILLSGDRGGFIQSLLGIVGLFILLPKWRRYGWILLLGGSLMIGGILSTNHFIFARQWNSLAQTIQHFTESDYGYVYRGGWQVFKHNPVFGVGLKNYRKTCGSYIIRSSEQGFDCSIHPHNIYLEWLAESGLIGLGLFLAILWQWGGILWCHRVIWLKDPMLVGAFLVLFVRLIPILPSGSFFIAWASIPVWLMAGWVLSCTKDGGTKY